jgi:hypothetical protein
LGIDAQTARARRRLICSRGQRDQRSGSSRGHKWTVMMFQRASRGKARV